MTTLVVKKVNEQNVLILVFYRVTPFLKKGQITKYRN